MHVEVSDTGVGMDEETRRRCLEPFFTTKGERGTGLGLAMVYGMVQRHSAEIEIESAPGEGTTVRLSFPASRRDRRERAASRRLGARRTVALRILMVDDDPLVIKSLRDTLEARRPRRRDDQRRPGGHRRLSAPRIERGRPFDVVITDLGMPYVDGRKVAAAVKAVSRLTRRSSCSPAGASAWFAEERRAAARDVCSTSRRNCASCARRSRGADRRAMNATPIAHFSSSTTKRRR